VIAQLPFKEGPEFRCNMGQVQNDINKNKIIESNGEMRHSRQT